MIDIGDSADWWRDDESLPRSEQRYRTTLDHVLEGCQLIGFGWRYLYMNDAAARHNRRPNDELLGKTMLEAWPGIEQSHVFSLLKRCMDERKPVHGETEFLFADGTSNWYDVRVQPVPEGIFVLSIDIQERRHTELLLRESEANFRLLSEALPQLIWSIDAEGRDIYFNQRWLDYTGVMPAQGVAMEWTRPLHVGDLARTKSAWAAARNSGTLLSLEVRLRQHDGIYRFWILQISPVRAPSGEVTKWFGVATDVHELKTAEFQLQRTEEQLRQAQKMEAIGRLAGGVAHDFNNLLSVILSCSSMVLEGITDETQRADMEEIHRAGERAAELTRQLLAFSRQQMLQPRVVELGHVVTGMEKMLQRLLGEDVKLALLTARTAGRVYVDPGQIEQIIMNLAVNSRDAMPNGGQLVIETVDVDSVPGHPEAAPGSHVMLAVSDNGAGMDVATRERIFEPFFTTKGVGKGTGLGLAMVFGIVKQSNGHIYVYSEPGVGTTFKIYLPCTDRDEGSSRSLIPVTPSTLRGFETVLLVEDNEQVRKVNVAILRRQGYKVLDAQNGGEALLICEKFGGKIQLLLTDVVMPHLNGRELAQRLNSLRPEMRVLYTSGYTADSVVLQGILDAGIAFLQKPITPDALLRKVREVLEA